MTLELTAETYECIVCCEPVRRPEGVWACGTCFRVMHAPCVAQWRERGGSGATRPGDPWRCPGCQTTHTAVPVDRCLCAAVERPDVNPFLVPHSCGQPCGRRRAGACPHPCEAVCHPGPCGPCPAMEAGVRTCGCGRTSFRLRCGTTPTGAQATCGAVCGRPLACGVRAHLCSRPCHEGPCAECDHPLMQTCYCGRHEEWRTCGSGSRAARSACLRLADAASVAPCVEVLAAMDPDAAAAASPSRAAAGARRVRVAAAALSETEPPTSDSDAEDDDDAPPPRMPAAFPLQISRYGAMVTNAGNESTAEASRSGKGGAASRAPPADDDAVPAGGRSRVMGSLLALLAAQGEESGRREAADATAVDGEALPPGALSALEAAANALWRQQPPRPAAALPAPALAHAALVVPPPPSPHPSSSAWLHAAPAALRPGYGYFSCGGEGRPLVQSLFVCYV